MSSSVTNVRRYLRPVAFERGDQRGGSRTIHDQKLLGQFRVQIHIVAACTVKQIDNAEDVVCVSTTALLRPSTPRTDQRRPIRVERQAALRGRECGFDEQPALWY